MNEVHGPQFDMPGGNRATRDASTGPLAGPNNVSRALQIMLGATAVLALLVCVAPDTPQRLALGNVLTISYRGIVIPGAFRLIIAAWVFTDVVLLARMVNANLEIEATARGVALALAAAGEIAMVRDIPRLPFAWRNALVLELFGGIGFIGLMYCWLTVGNRGRVRLLNVINLRGRSSKRAA